MAPSSDEALRSVEKACFQATSCHISHCVGSASSIGSHVFSQAIRDDEQLKKQVCENKSFLNGDRKVNAACVIANAVTRF